MFAHSYIWWPLCVVYVYVWVRGVCVCVVYVCMRGLCVLCGTASVCVRGVLCFLCLCFLVVFLCMRCKCKSRFVSSFLSFLFTTIIHLYIYPLQVQLRFVFKNSLQMLFQTRQCIRLSTVYGRIYAAPEPFRLHPRSRSCQGIHLSAIPNPMHVSLHSACPLTPCKSPNTMQVP